MLGEGSEGVQGSADCGSNRGAGFGDGVGRTDRAGDSCGIGIRRGVALVGAPARGEQFPNAVVCVGGADERERGIAVSDVGVGVFAAVDGDDVAEIVG